MAEIHRFFRALKNLGASDLHLVSRRPPMYRASGAMAALPGERPLSDTRLRELLMEIVSDTEWAMFMEQHDYDFATAVPGVARFRGNLLEQHHGVSAVFRMIPEEILSAETLGLSKVITDVAKLDSGLALVTGPTGSGKSTTLAAIVDCINRSTEKHIVTIEDPVEFVHQNQRSVLSHRQVGKDTNNFSRALRSALRQDADVILVGEMRDYETISLAIEAAGMGMLVFGTLHTNGAAKTVARIIDAFPADQQSQARESLSQTLSAVVSQLLAKKKGGGRVAVHEILLRTAGLPGAIREGKLAMISSVIEAGRSMGMQTMDNALLGYVKDGVIDGHEAYLKANDKKTFARWANGPEAVAESAEIVVPDDGGQPPAGG